MKHSFDAFDVMIGCSLLFAFALFFASSGERRSESELLRLPTATPAPTVSVDERFQNLESRQQRLEQGLRMLLNLNKKTRGW